MLETHHTVEFILAGYEKMLDKALTPAHKGHNEQVESSGFLENTKYFSAQ